MQSNLQRWMLLPLGCVVSACVKTLDITQSPRKYIFVTFTLISAYPARYVVVTAARAHDQLGRLLRLARSSARRKLTAAALHAEMMSRAERRDETRRDVTRGRARDPGGCVITRAPLTLSTRLLAMKIRWHSRKTLHYTPSGAKNRTSLFLYGTQIVAPRRFKDQAFFYAYLQQPCTKLSVLLYTFTRILHQT